MAPTVALVFGPFRLDAASGTVCRGQSQVALTPKAFAVLEHLATRAGRLVSKDELLDAVWPGVFVGDGALKVCIREIRKALEDDSKAPRFIETAHRRGYRFVAPVTREHATADAPLLRQQGPSRAPAPGETGSAETVPAVLRAAEIPRVHYAHSGDVNIAYQVVGDGPLDIVFVMGWVSHLEYFWAEPSFARFLGRLASFSRLILFDKRGTGLSDRVTELPTLEQRMDDVRAVMDAVGSTRAALLGVSEGGPMCSLFAATYPEKTEALVMIGTYAKRIWAPDYPWAPTADEREAFCEEILAQWGGPVGLDARAPSLRHDPAFRSWWSTYLRMGASPGAAVALTRMNAQIDVRHVLPTIRVPSLILHRTADRCLLVDEGRYVASLIPGARFVELPGEDHLPFVGDQDALLDEIEEFLIGSPHRLELDRVLATVLHGRFGSPERADPVTPGRDERAERYLGHLWKEVEWFRGRHVDVREGAFLATFDGPARAIRCACALNAAAHRFDVPFRAGLHTGECSLAAEGVRGLAVDIGVQVCDVAAPGEVLVSRTVRDLVAGSGIRFEARGEHRLDGVAGAWELFAVEHRPTPLKTDA